MEKNLRFSPTRGSVNFGRRKPSLFAYLPSELVQETTVAKKRYFVLDTQGIVHFLPFRITL